MVVLGIHGGVTIGQHEPAAAIIIDGKIVAACEEERILRIKSAYGYLPTFAISRCLELAEVNSKDIDMVVCPGKTYDDFEDRIQDFLRHSFGINARVQLVHHQEAHLASAFYGSGFERSLCISLDATGDGSSGFIAIADRQKGFEVLETIPTHNSLGLYYDDSLPRVY